MSEAAKTADEQIAELKAEVAELRSVTRDVLARLLDLNKGRSKVALVSHADQGIFDDKVK